MIFSAEAVAERLRAFLNIPFFRRTSDSTVLTTATNMRGEVVPLTLGDLRYAAMRLDELAGQEARAESPTERSVRRQAIEKCIALVQEAREQGETDHRQIIAWMRGLLVEERELPRGVPEVPHS